MTLNEAILVADCFAHGASLENWDNVRDMCEKMNRGQSGWVFMVSGEDDEDLAVWVQYA